MAFDILIKQYDNLPVIFALGSAVSTEYSWESIGSIDWEFDVLSSSLIFPDDFN